MNSSNSYNCLFSCQVGYPNERDHFKREIRCASELLELVRDQLVVLSDVRASVISPDLHWISSCSDVNRSVVRSDEV